MNSIRVGKKIKKSFQSPPLLDIHPLTFPGRFLSLVVHDFAARRRIRVCDVTIVASEVRDGDEKKVKARVKLRGAVYDTEK